MFENVRHQWILLLVIALVEPEILSQLTFEQTDVDTLS